jgi:hypothetical protein
MVTMDAGTSKQVCKASPKKEWRKGGPRSLVDIPYEGSVQGALYAVQNCSKGSYKKNSKMVSQQDLLAHTRLIS